MQNIRRNNEVVLASSKALLQRIFGYIEGFVFDALVVRKSSSGLDEESGRDVSKGILK